MRSKLIVQHRRARQPVERFFHRLHGMCQSRAPKTAAAPTRATAALPGSRSHRSASLIHDGSAERRRPVLPFFFDLPLQREVREAKIPVMAFLLVDQVMSVVQAFDGELQRRNAAA